MNDKISKRDLDYFLDIYESGIKDDIRVYPNNLGLKEKLKVIKDIRHRILVLSRGGFKLINKQGD